MRKIKFRGVNAETGEFVYGWYTKLVEGIRRFDAIISDVNGELTRFYIHDPKTIGQFTGLHDKNGKEIYEGDIISGASDFGNGIVKWNYMSWVLIHHFLDANAMIDDGEVIGNIHENPEIIK